MMMIALNKDKKKVEGMPKASPLDPQLMQAFNRGFSAGSKQQRESDIGHLVKWLEQLEEVPGIGEKTASKVTRYFLEKFGVK